MASEPDPEMFQEFFLPGLEGREPGFYRTRVSYWAEPSVETEEFAANGGFADVDPDHYSVLERDGRYRIRADILGLEASFLTTTAVRWGSDPRHIITRRFPEPFWRATYHAIPGLPIIRKRAGRVQDAFPWRRGDVLTLEEKLRDSDETDYSFRVEIGDRADKRPVLDEYNSDYSIQLYVPIETYREIVAGSARRQRKAIIKSAAWVTSVEKDIAVTEKIREISSRYMAEEDFTIRSREEELAGKRGVGQGDGGRGKPDRGASFP